MWKPNRELQKSNFLELANFPDILFKIWSTLKTAAYRTGSFDTFWYYKRNTWPNIVKKFNSNLFWQKTLNCILVSKCWFIFSVLIRTVSGSSCYFNAAYGTSYCDYGLTSNQENVSVKNFITQPNAFLII